MLNLVEIIKNLETKPEVDALFLMGSQENEHKPYSDIDLTIILKKHVYDLTSLYTWIDNKFADIFFFDHADLKRIESSELLSGNTMDAVFVSWLQKSVIQFDKSGQLTDLKNKIEGLVTKIEIPKSEKDLFCQKINYNLIANTRYFESNDPLYHEALEARLLYSVSEVFTGYFEFRNILWRGEKLAMKYLKENDSNFYDAFLSYTRASSLHERFNAYIYLARLAFTNDYQSWNKDGVFPQTKDRMKSRDQELIGYWNELIK